MHYNYKILLRSFLRQAFSLLLTLCLIRLYEYVEIASKFFVKKAYRFEIAGLFYDVWTWLIYCSVLLVPFLLLYYLSKRAATVFFHCINVTFIVSYLALIITFSERNSPFDHELFTRSFNDSVITAKQMLTTGSGVYFLILFYVALYLVLYAKVFKRSIFPAILLYSLGVFALLSISFIKYSGPSAGWFSQKASYYLVSNKFAYWLQDTYKYFKSKSGYNSHTSKSLPEKEIAYYQANQPFRFTSKEYPLLHPNNEKDVLGSFFNLEKSPPNIVILVVEGLSKDFSGEAAYAGSFTPFLDSLSGKSLTWNNFLSTAPGTFAAHPAITGSLPYGKRGFSIMNVMPDHLSLIKELRANGYFTNFMIGFNPDFDNMGGYIRLQGTDYILSKYSAKYKQMGAGSEGWSMGYPDDALFNRSFEVLDSINRFPYLSIYHTATTHMPYLFAQKAAYERLFDQKISRMKVSTDIRRTLKESKSVLVTFMFSDDCIKNFFNSYAKRTEYNNTIFFITGDHHIGSFPSTGEIDDYHVPFIIYSPMLKQPHTFYSVNSHNNITPTILSMLSNNYNLREAKEVHWLGSVLDTCSTFRNIHSMPFMSWSREIEDYIYKGYFVSGTTLYRLRPNLMLEEYENDTVRKKVVKLRENFKVINDYVCENNKIYPLNRDLLPGNTKLLLDFKDPVSKTLYSSSSDTGLMKLFEVPKGFDYLYVETSGEVNMPSSHIDEHPALRFALIDTQANKWNYIYWTMRNVITLSRKDFLPKHWNSVSAKDLFTLDDYSNIKNLNFQVALYTDSTPINLGIRNLEVKIYGVKR